MDAFLHSVSQHVNSFIGLWLMKQINTGDRMMDTTIQVLFSTVTGAIVTGLVTMYTKGLWKEWVTAFQATCGSGTHDGTVFNPSFAPEKPLNGTAYEFRSKRINSTPFWAWFNLYHASKRFTQKLTESLVLLEDRSEDKLLDTANGEGERIPSIEISAPIPIWKGQDSYYVFVRGHLDDDVTLVSDSGQALSECLNHFNAFKKRMEEHAAKQEARTTCHIREFSVKENRELGEVQSNRRLETMYFTQKEEIVRVLTAFKAKTLFPKHLPIDNKLGILLHGPPGTGKTGFIAAMANFLERDIMLIHTSQIRRRKHLDEIFEYDNSRYIFVFEEFDCMPGVQRRPEGTGAGAVDVSGNAVSAGGSTPKGPDATAYAMMLMAQKEKSEDLMEEMREERAAERDKVDLHYLLTKLDGLQSANERVIVATTNHPEKIDPALLRPGRFGLQLNLTNCTRAMLRDLLTMIYQVEGEDRIGLAIAVTGVEEMKWSPAEILQLGISKPGWAEVIEYLMTNEPARF